MQLRRFADALHLISQSGDAAYTQFCDVAADLILRDDEPNSKIYAAAALKLGVPADQVRLAVKALSGIFLDAAQNDMSADELRRSLLEELPSVFSNAFADAAVRCYDERIATASKIAQWRSAKQFMLALVGPVPSYRKLDWRLDIELARRTLLPADAEHRTRSVNVLLNIELFSPLSASRSLLLKVEPSTLLHIVKELEKALAELRTRECRRAITRLAR